MSTVTRETARKIAAIAVADAYDVVRAAERIATAVADADDATRFDADAFARLIAAGADAAGVRDRYRDAAASAAAAGDPSRPGARATPNA